MDQALGTGGGPAGGLRRRSWRVRLDTAVCVPVVTVELPNAQRTPLDSEMRQMWIDLLRWIGERAGQGLGDPVR